MITIYPYEQLGHVDHGWLNARHHFSFGSYYNPNRMNYGVIRVINDDIIKANNGFPSHPHQDMEIITYVKKGAVTHKDNMGNEGKTLAGDLQVMSAGTGIWHSEYNLENEDTNLYQIWIEPNKLGVLPRWETKQFPKKPVTDSLHLLVSGHRDDNALFIYQEINIYGGKLNEGKIIHHPITHQAYLLVAEGEISINDFQLKKGDGAEINDFKEVIIKARTEAEIVIIDIPDT